MGVGSGEGGVKRGVMRGLAQNSEMWCKPSAGLLFTFIQSKRP